MSFNEFMGYPKANWATIQNISKSLLSVPIFYQKTCDLMKELLLPPPFAEETTVPKPEPKPNYIFHTILDFICNKVTQILENDTLSQLSMSSISEILQYFKEKQTKELKENSQILNHDSRLALLEKLAEINLKFSTVKDITQENLKKTAYSCQKLQKPIHLPIKRLRNFSVEEPSTDYHQMDLSKPGNPYDEYLNEVEIKSKCIPLSEIPSKLLKRCQEESPSSSLFLFNLPKKCLKSELLDLFSQVYPGQVVNLQLMDGKLRGQGFLHLASPLIATKIKSTFFGFPFKGKPMILQYSKSNN